MDTEAADVEPGRIEVWVDDGCTHGPKKFSRIVDPECLEWDYEHDMRVPLAFMTGAIKAFETVQRRYPGSVIGRIMGRCR